MSKLRTSDLVNAIAQFGTQRVYNYPSGSAKFKIVEVTKPEGSIKFLRWNSNDSEQKGSIARISTNQLATIAFVFSNRPNYPIHLDRFFSAGGNSRSAIISIAEEINL